MQKNDFSFVFRKQQKKFYVRGVYYNFIDLNLNYFNLLGTMMHPMLCHVIACHCCPAFLAASCLTTCKPLHHLYLAMFSLDMYIAF